MKIIFMGTPDFAVPTLKALIASRHEVTAVYTKPDQEAGRGRKIVFSPVKEAALEAGIKVLQPEKLGKSAVEEMRGIPADVIVVAAYGKILRPSVLHMTKFGLTKIFFTEIMMCLKVLKISCRTIKKFPSRRLGNIDR